jgi:N-methylhydantoinase A
MSGARGLLIGVDTGGTFTDVAVLDAASGKLWVTKTPSTPQDPSVGFGEGVADGLRVAGAGGEQVDRVLHGTTVATNLILESKGPQTALLVTRGFRYVLEIGRHDIPRKASQFSWIKPKRPVSPQRVWEVGGRLDARGQVVEELDEAAVVAAARAIAAQDIKSVAVVLLHSYANAAHEQRVRELFSREHPDARLSLSSEVMPAFREYERCITTLLNAYVMPAVSTYVGRLERRIGDSGIRAPLLLMKSSGGVSSTRGARDRPVETALSGPAAGVVGAAFVGAASGFNNLISIDIGGTSADVGLIHSGTPSLTTTGTIGDWRVGLPMVDILTIGAGGGSIARLNQAGGLVVGPESAGAQPGPVCYRKGGTQPTVTDAHLVVGNLPEYLLGGAFTLDLRAAREAIRSQLAEPLGMDVETAARGVLDVANNNMVGAIRVMSVDRGLDPREFALMPFGGAGPLHGCAIARLIGCTTMLIPPAPGVLAALGLLVSNLRAEFSRTCVQRAGRFDVRQLAEVFSELRSAASAWFEAEAVEPAARVTSIQASLRYKDQGFELAVPWSGEGIDETGLQATCEAFHRKHEQLYGFMQRDMPLEIVTLRVDAIGILPPPALQELAPHAAGATAIIGSQRMALPGGDVQAPLYDRTRLGAGARIEGPAVITQLDATSVLLPRQTAIVDRYGALVVKDEFVARTRAQVAETQPQT